jgi:transposase-like protein
MSYTLRDFQSQFPDDRACLDFLFKTRWPNGGTCECGKKDCFYPIEKRRSYSCSWCGYQLYPTAGTIFHKSTTSLVSWFFAIFLMSTSRNGVAAKELERQLGVTYKTAWRMAHEIRKLMNDKPTKFFGECEADETYIGGKRPGKRGRGAAGKTAVVGIANRRGGVVAKVVGVVNTENVIGHIRANVEVGTTIHTDEYPAYNYVQPLGYKHEVVNHGRKEYARGKCHTNCIEGFWSQLKRSIDGTHHHVSRKYLQNYVNEFAFRYSNRYASSSMFELMAGRSGDLLSEAA